MYAGQNPINNVDPSGRADYTLADLQAAITIQAQQRGQQLANFRRGLEKTIETAADSSRYFGGLLALAAAVESFQYLPSAILFFGINAIGGVANTGRLGMEMLGNRKVKFHFMDAEWLKSQAWFKAGAEYIALTENKNNRIGSSEINVAILPGFTEEGGSPRPPVPVRSQGIGGTPSMAGIMVHEFAHIVLDAVDDAYLVTGVSQVVEGKLATKLLNPEVNADNYRLYTRAVTIGWRPHMDNLLGTMGKHFGGIV
jgi:hypothetical protein